MHYWARNISNVKKNAALVDKKRGSVKSKNARRKEEREKERKKDKERNQICSSRCRVLIIWEKAIGCTSAHFRFGNTI